MPKLVDRRRFLAALAAAPWLARSSRGEAWQGRGSSAVDPVVVVGAGLAGLRAADVLRHAGQRVMVIEAQSTPGGRVRTIRPPFRDGLYAEAGPIRIPSLHRTVIQLAREHRLGLVPFQSPNGSAVVTIAGVTARLPDDLGLATASLALKPDEAGLSQGALLQKYLGDLPSDIGEVAPPAGAYARWESVDRLTWPEWLESRGASPGAITDRKSTRLNSSH